MNWKKKKIDCTLVFPTRENGNEKETLLARKVRDLVTNCPNGFGGKINRRETPRTCATRELRKESGLVVLKEDLEFIGMMTFHNLDGNGNPFSVRVFIFTTSKWRGNLKLKEDEMTDPKWYKIGKLPLNKMAPADSFWVPLIFSGKKIKGQAWYGPGQKTLLRQPEIKVVKFLSDID